MVAVNHGFDSLSQFNASKSKGILLVRVAQEPYNMQHYGGMPSQSGQYQTPAHNIASSAGYEPKISRTVARDSQQISYMKIPDSMIKILPDWGYDWATREHFLSMFKRMLKSIGAVFLVQNERKECASSVGLETSFTTDGKQPEVGQAKFFSITGQTDGRSGTIW